MKRGGAFAMTASKRFGLWLPVVCYTGFIFWLSSAPRTIPGISRFPWLDKPIHAVEYLPLGFLLLRAILRSWGRLPVNQGRGWAAAGAFAVAALDELYQRTIPLRSASPFDVMADFAGALLGQLLYQRKMKRPEAP